MITKKCHLKLIFNHIGLIKTAKSVALDQIRFISNNRLLKNEFFLHASRKKFMHHFASTGLLETTHLKIINAYNDADFFIKQLVDERSELTKMINNENNSSYMQDDKHNTFKRLSYLNNIYELYKLIEKNTNDIRELSEMTNKLKNEDEKNDESNEMIKMIDKDLEELNKKLELQKYEMIQALIPEEQEDREDALIELSAGVGGSEARLFCSEMFNMYKLYSNLKNWSFVPIMVDLENEMMRKATIEISGSDVFKYFKFESGVHRVQRVPKTESKGRIHTSTVGVIVSPKPSEIKIEINPKDLKIDAKTHGGPGGQHANKTASAIRLTHLPTGIVINCEEERFQHQNKARALKYLKLRLYQIAYEEQLNKKQANRKMQIGSSSRSERIRTYNFIQDRISDHRLNENFTGIAKFFSGTSLYEMIENLKAEQQIELLYEILEEKK